MSDKCMLRINGNRYVWADKKRGLEAAVKKEATQYALDYQLTGGLQILVEVMDVAGDWRLGAVPDKVLQSFAFKPWISIELEPVEIKGGDDK